MEDQKSKPVTPGGQGLSSDTIPSFLLKTYEILENQKFMDTICWTRNGEGFVVKKVKQFSENVLPIYFRHSNYTSFVRQLNMYDFHKTRQENHENAFKNLMFKKGSKNLLKNIQRKDYKKNKDNAKQGTSNEKNLERSNSHLKNQRQYEFVKDLGKQSLKKINELKNSLEKKSLYLAEIREIPEKPSDLLRLLDTLFDAKKLHRELVESMEKWSAGLKEEEGSTAVQLSFQREAEKGEECLSTEAREAILMLTPKEKEEQTTGTRVSLFSSFNHI